MSAGRPTPSNAPARLPIDVPVPWVFVLGYLVGVAIEMAWPPRVLAVQAPRLNLAGAVVFAVGAGIAAWGWLTFHKAGTTTIPGKVSTRLVTWGPYRFTRNPMYVGLTIAYLGEAGILQQLWPVVFLPLVLAYVDRVVIPVEEANLQRVFGDAYDEYRRRVRRWV